MGKRRSSNTVVKSITDLRLKLSWMFASFILSLDTLSTNDLFVKWIINSEGYSSERLCIICLDRGGFWRSQRTSPVAASTIDILIGFNKSDRLISRIDKQKNGNLSSKKIPQMLETLTFTAVSGIVPSFRARVYIISNDSSPSSI